MKTLCLLVALVGCAHYPAPKTDPAPASSSVISDEQAEAGTYMITFASGLGTAWAVDEHHLITAGHVCEAGGADYYVLVQGSKRFVARPLAWEMDYPDGAPPRDVCVLETLTPLTPLPLATEMPAVGTTMQYYGYPLGRYGHFKGEYVGDVDGPDNWENDFGSTAPCDHGSSGSAVYTEAGVYGVLVRLYTSGDMVLPGEYGCVATPLSQIVSILSDAGV